MPKVSQMDRRDETARAPDGRTLMYAEWGDLGGAPVIALHGTPGSRLSRHPNEDLVRSAGAHLVTYDRAGYGGSDRNRGRSVADCVGDVEAIADAVGFGRFAVTGGSGGGPHALAVAALLGERVTRAIADVCPAPYDVMGEDWTLGMDRENVREFELALEGEARLLPYVDELYSRFVERGAADASSMFDEYDLPEADRAVLTNKEFAAVSYESIVESGRNGVFGWVDDDLCLVRPWGFDPACITVPLQIWYGTADVLVPPAHGKWLADHISTATVRVSEGGHIGNPDEDLVEALGWLTKND